MDMVKLALLGTAGVMAAVVLKSYKPEYGVLMGIAVCLAVMGYGIRYLSGVLSSVGQMTAYLKDNDSYIKPLLKAAGATYACEFCAGICKDAGFGGIAGQVELAGKLYILLIGMPILLALLQSIQSLAG